MICWLPANSLRGDGLDYPGGFGSTLKHYPMYNEKLIELQKEYAKDFLIHVNPYTGLAYADDPAIITVQINNEESTVKGDMGADITEQLKPYRAAANGVDIMEIEVTGLNGNRLPSKNKNSYEYEQTAEDWKEADSVWGRYEEENSFPGGASGTAEEDAALADYYNTYMDYQNSMVAKFIMGTEELTEENHAAYVE